MTMPATLAASIEKLKPLVALAVPTGPSDGAPRGARNANPTLLSEALSASIMLARACVKLGEMREARQLMQAVESLGENSAEWLRLQSRLDQMNGDAPLQGRLKAFVGDFARLKQDVTIDFVLRLADVVGFVDAVGGSAKIDTTGMPPAKALKTDSTVRDSATVVRRDAPKKDIRENFWGTLNALSNPPNWTKLPDDGADMDVEGPDDEIEALLHFRDS